MTQLKILSNSYIVPGWDGNGYAKISERLPYGLEKAGAKLLSAADFGWDVLLQISPPRSAIVGPFAHRSDICWHTMFEAYPMPPVWRDIINRGEIVWAPSTWVKELFIECGVTRPIFVAGYAVDGQTYRFRQREPHDGPFKVVAWGDTILSRKNILKCMQVFHNAFPNNENVILEVKISDAAINGNGSHMVPEFDGKPDHRISIISEYWDKLEIVKWLQGADVGLYLSGGEGGGMMPLEMMATGLPMVVAYNTGMMDYLEPSSALLIDCPTRAEYPSLNANFGMPLLAYVPDFKQAAEKLRWCWQNPEAAYEIGARGAERARTWTWESQGAIAYAELLKHFG